MIETRLVTYGVFALGILMIIVGLAFVSFGVPIVRMELGWTEIIGGAVAASAGAVILALGGVLVHLEAIQHRFDASGVGETRDTADDALVLRPTLTSTGDEESAEVRPVHPLAPAARRERAAALVADVRPEPTLTAALHPDEPDAAPLAPIDTDGLVEPVLDLGAPDLAHQDEEKTETPSVSAPDPVASPIADQPATTRTRSSFLSSILARRGNTPSDERRPSATAEQALPAVRGLGQVEAPQRTVVDLSSGWDDEPPTAAADAARDSESLSAMDDAAILAEHPAPTSAPAHDAVEAPHDELATPIPVTVPPAIPLPVEPDPLQPVVVGRYNAGAASYVMYSNGMIEVETEQGTHQFASMQELKAFIERRDATVS